ncbi:MAG TPA: anhydro-N-acetylmuramic acid kinase [Ignavibacteriaceae bacterium]|nr:anhydro-N-acetylmuramic acid kinase [Ignavibacteriaceae bacterium]
MSVKNLYQLSKKNTKYVIGLMSGTSLDGIDAVLLQIKGNSTKTKVSQLAFGTYPFPLKMKEMMLKNAEYMGGNVTEICKLNFLIAHAYVKAVKNLCSKASFPLANVDLIGSHGQTVHHLPKPESLFGFKTASTLQIGDPAVIAKLTGITTVGDFRTGDVALGGEGAPLVPYFDFIMFHSDKVNRALLNIGGISNITVLKKGCGAEDVFGFDTGPGNMLIDSLMRSLYNKEYDKNGHIAKSGKVNPSLLEKMLTADKFVKQKPPKSSGREYYGKYFLPDILKNFNKLPHEDLVATATDYTARSVYYNYIKFVAGKVAVSELFVSGGGANNPVLMTALQKYFGNKVKIMHAESLGISSDAKEAICFAVLANETISGNPANIPLVTGASKATILGKICLP